MPANFSKKELLSLIDKLKSRIKSHDIIKEMFNEWDLPISIIDYIPMLFADIDVSAKTDHGIIYLNNKLINDGLDNDDHYLIHEITHWLQQCFSKDAIPSSEGEDYLDNKFEQEAFQNQTEYISDTQGDERAEKYIKQVLDHHNVSDKKERKERMEELLSIANFGLKE
jgi:hypothetical protein